jgi:hypothetical protein
VKADGLQVQGQPREKVAPRPSLENKIKNKQIIKKAWDIAQVVEHLPSLCKAMGSIPYTTKIKENERIVQLP